MYSFVFFLAQGTRQSLRTGQLIPISIQLVDYHLPVDCGMPIVN